MRKIILITDRVHEHLPQSLKKLGYEVIYDTSVSMKNLAGKLPQLYGIVINSKIKMNKEMIDHGVNLKFIARLGSGMEIVDITYAKQKNIRVINTPEGNCNAVAEHAIGMLLMMANNLHFGNKEVKSFHWDREGNRGFELKGKTIGIIGVGHTGAAFAKKLQGWEMNVLGYDKYKSGYAKNNPELKETTLEEVQREADIISFHLPLTAETKHYCDQGFLDACAKDVILINTSRGQVIPTGVLIENLNSSRVKAACLDVFENEKTVTMSESEKELYEALYAFPQVVVTPHVAGWTHESLLRIAELVLERIENGYTM